MDRVREHHSSKWRIKSPRVLSVWRWFLNENFLCLAPRRKAELQLSGFSLFMRVGIAFRVLRWVW